MDVSSDNGYNKDNKRIIDLQFFGDPGFSRQTDKQLEKSIRSLKKNIALHQQKQKTLINIVLVGMARVKKKKKVYSGIGKKKFDDMKNKFYRLRKK